jgi:hypothetical protein
MDPWGLLAELPLDYAFGDSGHIRHYVGASIFVDLLIVTGLWKLLKLHCLTSGSTGPLSGQ